MDSAAAALHLRLADRLRALRAERGLSLDGLAERAGVSRSMISLVERAESSPTAAVLDRLAAGLGVTIATLFAEAPRADGSPIARRDEQAAWRDPATGYVRRNLSPPSFASPLVLVEIVLPAGARVAYDTSGASRTVRLGQQIWVLEGRLALTLGDATHDLDEGDCLAMRVEGPITFHNPASYATRYIVALAGDPTPPSPRNAP